MDAQPNESNIDSVKNLIRRRVKGLSKTKRLSLVDIQKEVTATNEEISIAAKKLESEGEISIDDLSPSNSNNFARIMLKRRDC